MTTEPANGRNSAEALDGYMDIAESYEVLSDLASLVGVSSGQKNGIVNRIRSLVKGEGGVL